MNVPRCLGPVSWLALSSLHAYSAYGESNRDCSHDDIKTARAAYELQMKARAYAAAVEVLDSLEQRCSLVPGPEPESSHASQATLDFFWVMSDKSYALYKAGRYAQCLKILGSVTSPYHGWNLNSYQIEDGERVAQAIEYNQKLCQDAHDARFASFSESPCQGSVHPGAVQLPKSWGLKANKAYCLELGEVYAKQCPLITLAELSENKSGLDVQRRVRLSANEGPLLDESWCCTLEKISIGTMDGKRMVRIESGDRIPRVCGGGTAARILDALYEWNNRRLMLREDNSIGLH